MENTNSKPTFKFYLNSDGSHDRICRFCKKPYGKYTIELNNGKSFYSCNKCLLGYIGSKTTQNKPNKN